MFIYLLCNICLSNSAKSRCLFMCHSGPLFDNVQNSPLFLYRSPNYLKIHSSSHYFIESWSAKCIFHDSKWKFGCPEPFVCRVHGHGWQTKRMALYVYKNENKAESAVQITIYWSFIFDKVLFQDLFVYDTYLIK